MTFNPSALTLAFTALTMIFLPACAGEEDTSACPANEVDCDGTCIPAIAPTAEAVTERILMPSCAQSACHQGYSAQEGLSLDDLETLREAISQPSAQDPEVNLIEPGDASNSYLVRKMRDVDITEQSTTYKPAGVMPPGLGLCEPKIKAVEDWINAGAN